LLPEVPGALGDSLPPLELASKFPPISIGSTLLKRIFSMLLRSLIRSNPESEVSPFAKISLGVTAASISA
jgi:hypothetical protein